MRARRGADLLSLQVHQSVSVVFYCTFCARCGDFYRRLKPDTNLTHSIS